MNLRLTLTALAIASCLSAQPPRQIQLGAPPPPPTNAGGSIIGTPGTTPLFYWVIVNYPAGAVVSAPVTVPNTVGANNLSSLNYVVIQWSPMPSATSYSVVRATTPTFPGTCSACGIAVNVTASTANDQGAPSAYTLPTAAGDALAQMYLNNVGEAQPYLQLQLNNSLYRVAPLSGPYTVGNSPAFGPFGTLVDAGVTPGGGSVTGGPFTSTAVAVGGPGAQGIRTICAGCTLDAAGNLTLTGGVALGGAANGCDGTAGCYQMGQGTAPSGLTATTVKHYQGTSVTAHNIQDPAAPGTGPLYRTCTGTSCVDSIAGATSAGGVQRIAYSALPGTCDATNTNTQYLFTDGAGVSVQCNGTSYARFYGGYPTSAVPAAASWTAVGTIAPTLADHAGTVSFSQTFGATLVWTSMIKAVPAAPFSAILGFDCALYTGTNNACAFAIADGNTTAAKLQLFEFYQDLADVVKLRIINYSDYATFSSAPFGGAQFTTTGGVVWMKYDDDGVNRTYSYSIGGPQGPFHQYFQQVRTSFFTATFIGFAVAGSGSLWGEASVVSWSAL